MIKSLCTIFLLAIGTQPLHASADACSPSKAGDAENVAGALRNWDAMLDAYKKYAACDDGAIAAGFTESVVRILVDHWESVDRLQVLSSKDKKFRLFVLNHINESAHLPDLDRVADNASKHCPQRAHSLCADIVKTASSSKVRAVRK